MIQRKSNNKLTLKQQIFSRCWGIRNGIKIYPIRLLKPIESYKIGIQSNGNEEISQNVYYAKSNNKNTGVYDKINELYYSL